MAKLNASEWYFFSFRDRKYATGYRTNRATTCGYWKATGKDRTVHDPVTSEIVGMRKTLVFYLNRAPNGIKTGWIMHEFRLESPHAPPREDWVLCRVFYKSKQGESCTNDTSPISTPPPPNTFQNNLKPNATSPPPPNNNDVIISMPPQNNNNAFHKHNVILSTEFQFPQVTMSLNPNSLFHHLALEPNLVPTPISIAAVQNHSGESDDKDDDCLRFLWGLKDDGSNGMDIVSTLEDQLGFGVDDNNMLLFP